jgi:hypothetical protein
MSLKGPIRVKNKASKRPGGTTAAVLTELFTKVVTLEGKRMSMREAMLRALQNGSIGGDMDAALDLQKLRDINGVTDNQQAVGCLLIPEDIPLEQWEKLCAEQQAPFRDANYSVKDL